MKKNVFILGAMALTLAVGGIPSMRIDVAKAEEKQYTLEYAEDGVTLPLLHLEDGESYCVDVFKGSDIEYTTPLEKKNAYTFVADGLGEYLLRYLINRNGVESYEYATLVLEDTTAPTFTFAVKETYAVGETLSILPKIQDNTASLAVVDCKLICNGNIATSMIENNRLTFSTVGAYKLQITVTDGGGNTAKQLYEFTVAEGSNSGTSDTSSGESSSGCNASVTYEIGALTALCGALLLKKKEER